VWRSEVIEPTILMPGAPRAAAGRRRVKPKEMDSYCGCVEEDLIEVVDAETGGERV